MEIALAASVVINLGLIAFIFVIHLAWGRERMETLKLFKADSLQTFEGTKQPVGNRSNWLESNIKREHRRSNEIGDEDGEYS